MKAKQTRHGMFLVALASRFSRLRFFFVHFSKVKSRNDKSSKRFFLSSVLRCCCCGVMRKQFYNPQGRSRLHFFSSPLTAGIFFMLVSFIRLLTSGYNFSQGCRRDLRIKLFPTCFSDESRKKKVSGSK